MDYIFEIADKTGRKIHLTKERWGHIRKKHPEVEDLELLKETIKNPDKIIDYILDETIYNYYKYFKNRKSPTKYLLVSVKYLNDEGYIVTAYFEKYIK